ncbi:MAG: rhomboid family intramembrane serine protease [Bacteroidales bacterium]|nr:rhomboid family intramembrane serine protease [Bacteroidales bacterium]
MRIEEKAMLKSFFVPAIFLLLMWWVKFAEWIFDFPLTFLGIHPLHWDGLPGILLSPFIHGDWKHLAANSVPLLVLGAALYFFYRNMATKIFFLILLITGVWVWLGARDSYHIGASGVIYGLSTFLLLSGFIRKETRLMALSLVVVFLYGSFVWGIFPQFFPEKNISWEGHLSGMIAGVVLAIFYRNEGPQRRKYSWELEEQNPIEEPETDTSERPYWDVPEPDRKDLTVVYRFKKNDDSQ